MNVTTLTKRYFDLSNIADFDGIEGILQESVTYSSDNTGLHFGRKNVMAMTRAFYGAFAELHWDVSSINEINDNIAEVRFTFNGTKLDGIKVSRSGIERIVIEGELIRHVEVRNG